MALIHVLYVLSLCVGLFFVPRIVILVGIIVFLYLYFYNYSRDKYLSRIAHRFDFNWIDNEEAMLKVMSSHLALFKNTDFKVERAIGKKHEFHEVIMADLTAYCGFRFLNIINILTFGLVSGGNVYGAICKTISNSFFGNKKKGKKSEESSGSKKSRRTLTSFLWDKIVTLDRIPNKTVTAIFYVDADLGLPSTFLAKESVGEKMLAVIGGQDVDFEEDVTFSDRFVLQGGSEGNLTKFFDESVRSFFVSNMPLEMVYESCQDRYAMRVDKLANNKEMVSLIETGNRFYKKFKGPAK